MKCSDECVTAEPAANMPFPYYSRLSARQQAIYRASDRITEIALPRASALVPLVEALREALSADERRAVTLAVRSLSQALLDQLHAPALTLRVLAVRPSRGWGELHGLYTAEENKTAEIRLWMRTARQAHVVAFRTFLRTLLHELCHHLDYHTLKLGDSFHTEGFFRRESSLFRQLVSDAAPRRPRDASRSRRSAEAVRGERPRDPRSAAPAPRATTEGERQGRLRFDSD